MKDTIGAGRCFPNLPQLYQRTRQVLMAHQERPIYEFLVADSAPNFAGSALRTRVPSSQPGTVCPDVYAERITRRIKTSMRRSSPRSGRV